MGWGGGGGAGGTAGRSRAVSRRALHAALAALLGFYLGWAGQGLFHPSSAVPACLRVQGPAGRAGWGRKGDETPRRLRILTTATFSHRDMLSNWLSHVRKIESLEPHVIALDAGTAKFCKGLGASVELADTEGLIKSMTAKGLKFTNVGVAKLLSLQVVQRVLKGGSDVLFSDVDVAWLSDPLAYLDTEPQADLLISIDCLSPRYDEGREPPIKSWADYFPAQAWPRWWPRCGHTNGDEYGVAYNAGVLFLRANARTFAFMDAFVENMLKMAAPADNHLEGSMLHDMTDQESLIHLVAEGAYPLKMLPGSKRVFSTMGGRLNAGTFPVSVVANGHVYFVQRHHQKIGRSPVAVHATFNPGGNPGKVNRFREAHLWDADPETYFDDAGHNGFIAYDGTVPLELLDTRTAGSQIEAHLRLMSFYAHVTMHLLALGRALGRVPVMPQLICLCDRDEHPDILPTCITGGSDLDLPFQCPMDHLFNMQEWADRGIDFRPATFLENNRLLLMDRSKIAVVKAFGEPGNRTKSVGSQWQYEQRFNESTHLWERVRRPSPQQVRVPFIHGVVSEEFVKNLQGLTEFRVLKVAGLVPSSSYCAKNLDPDPRALEQHVGRLIRDNHWCCAAFDKAAPGTYRDIPVPWPGTLPSACPDGQSPL